MTPGEYQTALELLDTMMQQFYQTYRGYRQSRAKDQLAKLRELYGESGTPYVQVNLGVMDRERERAIKIGWIDITYCDDGELFVLGRDITQLSLARPSGGSG